MSERERPWTLWLYFCDGECVDAYYEDEIKSPVNEFSDGHGYIRAIEHSAYDALLEKAREAEEIIKFYADNRGLRINFESNKFESADSDGKDFHGAMARKYIEKYGVR